MQKIVAICALVIGLAIIAVAILGVGQLRSLARAAGSPNLTDYPLVQLVGQDLLVQQPGNSTPQPADVASKIQMRIYGIGIVGLVIIFLGSVLLFQHIGQTERAN